MYGLVNKAVRDFAIQMGGKSAWQSIRTAANLTNDDFIKMQTYDDRVTYDLVEAAAVHFDMDAEYILRGFGRHWILYTGAEGYGELLDFYGRDLHAFIGNLDAMHVRLQAAMPGLIMPRFQSTQQEDGSLLVDYGSEREGLEPMVVGLLEGVGERFEQPVAVTRIPPIQGYRARFEVRLLEPTP